MRPKLLIEEAFYRQSKFPCLLPFSRRILLLIFKPNCVERKKYYFCPFSLRTQIIQCQEPRDTQAGTRAFFRCWYWIDVQKRFSIAMAVKCYRWTTCLANKMHLFAFLIWQYQTILSFSLALFLSECLPQPVQTDRQTDEQTFVRANPIHYTYAREGFASRFLRGRYSSTISMYCFICIQLFQQHPK